MWKSLSSLFHNNFLSWNLYSKQVLKTCPFLSQGKKKPTNSENPPRQCNNWLYSFYSNFSSTYYVLVRWRPSLLCRVPWIEYSCRDPRKLSLHTVWDLHRSGDVSINQADTFQSYCKIPIARNIPPQHELNYSLALDSVLL